MCLHLDKSRKKVQCSHCLCIQSTSCNLERHCGLQGERADPLHHHYHYHHQSSFKWHSWTRQHIKPLAWPHLDIRFERGKMEQERELKERDGWRGGKECGWEEKTSVRKVILEQM